VGDIGGTTCGGAEDLEAFVTKMAGTVGGGGGGYGQVRQEDAALVRVEDETKRGSMLSEEDKDESDIGKRGDAM
jgi:hypothetical protein